MTWKGNGRGQFENQSIHLLGETDDITNTLSTAGERTARAVEHNVI
jgi:azurin